MEVLSRQLHNSFDAVEWSEWGARSFNGLLFHDLQKTLKQQIH